MNDLFTIQGILKVDVEYKKEKLEEETIGTYNYGYIAGELAAYERALETVNKIISENIPS